MVDAPAARSLRYQLVHVTYKGPAGQTVTVASGKETELLLRREIIRLNLIELGSGKRAVSGWPLETVGRRVLGSYVDVCCNVVGGVCVECGFQKLLIYSFPSDRWRF